MVNEYLLVLGCYKDEIALRPFITVFTCDFQETGSYYQDKSELDCGWPDSKEDNNPRSNGGALIRNVSEKCSYMLQLLSKLHVKRSLYFDTYFQYFQKTILL